MRAVMVMFDSLNRLFLPAYGATDVDLPNFRRLAEQSVTFDRCYAGSMPCMPARREMHTGRYNFLHRGWGPIEPFDDSVPEMLKGAGIYTHLITDHQHYWEDGGATYHNRYSTYEFFRGQEGDAWKGEVADPVIPETVTWRKGRLWRQDWINRKYLKTAADYPQTQTFDAGLGFMRTNADDDNWFLQIECFDPHEPFFTDEAHKARAGAQEAGPHYDWPDYRPVLEDPETLARLRKSYAALLTMCDDNLGRVMDLMDTQDMWKDTMLIVCTDHGFLLGEHGWFGKNIQPWFEENIHTPLFLWDPRTKTAGTRSDALVQTVDFGPTLLEYFGVDRTPDMQGRPIAPVLSGSEKPRQHALFGVFGGHVNITDGRYVYMRGPATPSNGPLHEYTLMPTRMDHRFAVPDLQEATLSQPFGFSKGVPLLKVRGMAMGNPYAFGSLLYDLETDPEQRNPLIDDDRELLMAQWLVEAMREAEAPPEQYERLGLPETGDVGPEHLLVRRQRALSLETLEQDWTSAPETEFSPALRQPIETLDKTLLEQAASALGLPASEPFIERFGYLSLWQISVMLPSVSPERLRAFERTHGQGVMQSAN